MTWVQKPEVSSHFESLDLLLVDQIHLGAEPTLDSMCAERHSGIVDQVEEQRHIPGSLWTGSPEEIAGLPVQGATTT